MVTNPRSTLNCLASFGIGGLVSTGHPFGIAAAIFMPAFSMRQASRFGAYQAAFCYYAGASWPVIPAARNFFGSSASTTEGITAWLAAAVLLATPWALLWTPRQGQLIWRVLLGLTASVIPPLGIIGWASPLTSAGLLFPRAAWLGLAAFALLCATLCMESLWPHTVIAVAVLAVASYAEKGADPQPPPGWETFNTNFGAIAHGPANVVRQFQTAQWIQNRTRCSNARVLIFPEMVVPRWTAATELFWQQTLANLTASGKTLLIGAGIPISSGARGGEITRYDFASAVAVLRAEQTTSLRRPGIPDETETASYRNALLMRGAHRGVYSQHVPVPLGMWHPFGEAGVPLNLFGPGVIRIDRQRAAVLICYEQLLTWPILLAAFQHPTVLIGMANDYWVEGTPIPRYEGTAIRAWARLFGIPLLAARNR